MFYAIEIFNIFFVARRLEVLNCIQTLAKGHENETSVSKNEKQLMLTVTDFLLISFNTSVPGAVCQKLR